MTASEIDMIPERLFSWELWLAGRAERRRCGNLVAPPIIRRRKRVGDDYVSEAYQYVRSYRERKPADSDDED